MYLDMMRAFMTLTNIVGVVINIGVLYFMITKPLLRDLSVAGIIIMCTINDIILNVVMFVRVVAESAPIYFAHVVHSYLTCGLVEIGTFFVIPASKASLLCLSIDRLYAVFKPFKYLGRNHTRFSAVVAVVVTFQAAAVLAATAFTMNWSSTSMNDTSCRPQTIIGTPFNLMLVYTYGIDLITYILNIVLIIKFRRGSHKITHITVTQRAQRGKSTNSHIISNPAGGSNHQARQKSITRSVIGAVVLHFIVTTAPFISTPLIMIGSRTGILSPESTLMSSMIIVSCATLETIGNAIVYVRKLPQFSRLVKAAFTWSKN